MRSELDFSINKFIISLDNLILFFVSYLIVGKCFSDQLINEFNFSATIDGLYQLEDGRTFESSSLKGHIKNNIGNKGV